MPDIPSRRRFLHRAGAVGLAAVAGCTSGDSATDDGADADEPTSEETATETEPGDETPTEATETSSEPEFEIVSIDAPDEVAIGELSTFSITVENTGGADGTWTQTLGYKIPDSDWQQMGELELDVPAGEQATWESSEGTFPYQTQLTYRLEEADREFTINYVSATLPYGDSYVSPDDIEVVVSDVELTPYYEYEDYDGEMTDERADDGMQWAFVHLRAENVGSESGFTPLDSDVSIIADQSQYDSEYINKEDGRFEGGEIEAGIVREGWLVYSIPDDLSHGDFSVSWTDSDYVGEWTVRWTGE